MLNEASFLSNNSANKTNINDRYYLSSYPNVHGVDIVVGGGPDVFGRYKGFSTCFPTFYSLAASCFGSEYLEWKQEQERLFVNAFISDPARMNEYKNNYFEFLRHELGLVLLEGQNYIHNLNFNPSLFEGSYGSLIKLKCVMTSLSFLQQDDELKILAELLFDASYIHQYGPGELNDLLQHFEALGIPVSPIVFGATVAHDCDDSDEDLSEICEHEGPFRISNKLKIKKDADIHPHAEVDLTEIFLPPEPGKRPVVPPLSFDGLIFDGQIDEPNLTKGLDSYRSDASCVSNSSNASSTFSARSRKIKNGKWVRPPSSRPSVTNSPLPRDTPGSYRSDDEVLIPDLDSELSIEEIVERLEEEGSQKAASLVASSEASSESDSSDDSGSPSMALQTLEELERLLEEAMSEPASLNERPGASRREEVDSDDELPALIPIEECDAQYTERNVHIPPEPNQHKHEDEDEALAKSLTNSLDTYEEEAQRVSSVIAASEEVEESESIEIALAASLETHENEEMQRLEQTEDRSISERTPKTAALNERPGSLRRQEIDSDDELPELIPIEAFKAQKTERSILFPSESKHKQEDEALAQSLTNSLETYEEEEAQRISSVIAASEEVEEFESIEVALAASLETHENEEMQRLEQTEDRSVSESISECTPKTAAFSATVVKPDAIRAEVPEKKDLSNNTWRPFVINAVTAVMFGIASFYMAPLLLLKIVGLAVMPYVSAAVAVIVTAGAYTLNPMLKLARAFKSLFGSDASDVDTKAVKQAPQGESALTATTLVPAKAFTPASHEMRRSTVTDGVKSFEERENVARIALR